MRKLIILLVVCLIPSIGLFSETTESPFYESKANIPPFFLLKPDTKPVFPLDTVNTLPALFGTNIDTYQRDGDIVRKPVTAEQDTSSSNNRIERIWHSRGTVNVKVVLEDKDVNLTLKVYNMLGKEVAEIHKGTQPAREYTHEFPDAGLPNGIYICTLTGPNFRDTEKFIVSR